jgi:hypothetical protein
MRILVVAITSWPIMLASWSAPALAQTQPTRQSAYATIRTMQSAYATAALSPCRPSFNPAGPCYSGTIYPFYSAIAPEEVPARTNRREGADSLDEAQVKARIEAKDYLNVSELRKDDHGIWRGKATMKNGKAVVVILDLEGNIYSEWIR